VQGTKFTEKSFDLNDVPGHFLGELAVEVLDEDFLFERDIVVFRALEQSMKVVATYLTCIDLVGTQDTVILILH
jgi:hypothetical protein